MLANEQAANLSYAQKSGVANRLPFSTVKKWSPWSFFVDGTTLAIHLMKALSVGSDS